MLSLQTKMETVTDDVLDNMHKSIENLEKTKLCYLKGLSPRSNNVSQILSDLNKTVYSYWVYLVF